MMEAVIEKKTTIGSLSTGNSPVLQQKKQIETKFRFPLRSFYLMGTRVDNINSELALQMICQYASERNINRMRKVFFLNVHSICSAFRDEILKWCINFGDLVLPDGSGLKLGGKVTGNPIVENINGTDFTPKVLRIAEEEGWSVFFFGAKEEVVQECCRRVRVSYPKLKIAGYRNGYFRDEEEREIVDLINRTQPDILLVALGTPKQEVWLTRYAYDLNAKVSFAVGGLFDFLSLKRKRAPLWMRRFGIEWLYRFLHEPAAKWERVIIEIPMFLSMLVAKKYFPSFLQRTIRRVMFS